jgi:hypothetical protein
VQLGSSWAPLESELFLGTADTHAGSWFWRGWPATLESELFIDAVSARGGGWLSRGWWAWDRVVGGRGRSCGFVADYVWACRRVVMGVDLTPAAGACWSSSRWGLPVEHGDCRRPGGSCVKVVWAPVADRECGGGEDACGDFDGGAGGGDLSR